MKALIMTHTQTNLPTRQMNKPEVKMSILDVLIGLQATKCRFAYDIIKENMDIVSLAPGDRSTIEELKTTKTLHRIQKHVAELEKR